jgi:hypothetical protein
MLSSGKAVGLSSGSKKVATSAPLSPLHSSHTSAGNPARKAYSSSSLPKPKNSGANGDEHRTPPAGSSSSSTAVSADAAERRATAQKSAIISPNAADHRTSTAGSTSSRPAESADAAKRRATPKKKSAIISPNAADAAERRATARRSSAVISPNAADYRDRSRLSALPEQWSINDALSGRADTNWANAIRNNNAQQCSINGYGGGGWIKSPDGELYPIVIPSLNENGHRYTADDGILYPGQKSVANLGNADLGWTRVSSVQGNEIVGEHPALSLRIAVGTYGALSGVSVPIIPNAPASTYERLQISSDSMPRLHDQPQSVSLESPPQTLDQPSRPVIVRLADGSLTSVDQYDPESWSRDVRRSGLNPATPRRPRAAGASNGIDLGVMVAEGVVSAANLQESQRLSYIVSFEENADGRRRATIQTFHIVQSSGGQDVIQPSHLYMNEQGEMASERIIYYRHSPSWDDPNKNWSVNQYVPDTQ